MTTFLGGGSLIRSISSRERVSNWLGISQARFGSLRLEVGMVGNSLDSIRDTVGSKTLTGREMVGR